MTGSAAIPSATGGASVRFDDKRGLSPILLAGLGGVLLIGGLALVLGLTGSNSFIDNVRNRIPGLSVESNDGWQTVDVADGGFTAQMPPDNQRGFTSAPNFTAGGRMEQLLGKIGSDTELSVSWAGATAAKGNEAYGELKSIATAWGYQNGGQFALDQINTDGSLRDSINGSFAGYPAIDVRYQNFLAPGSTTMNHDGFARAMLILRGDRVYILQSQSIYQEPPGFGKLVSGFSFT